MGAATADASAGVKWAMGANSISSADDTNYDKNRSAFRSLRSAAAGELMSTTAMPSGHTETNTFMSTILQGHNASRELLLVGVSAFAMSLLFAVLLYQKTQITSASAHAYSAINLDDSAITDDTDFENDFGNLIDDQYDIDVSSNDRGVGTNEEDDWSGFRIKSDDGDDDLDDDDDEIGFQGVFS